MQWHTLESSRVAAATPDFFGEWVEPLAQKYLHYKNSTTYKNI